MQLEVDHGIGTGRRHVGQRWNEPISRVELIWVVVAFLWGLFMFGFMIAWHFIGQQNLNKEAYRILPSTFETKVERSIGSTDSRCSRPTSISRCIPATST